MRVEGKPPAIEDIITDHSDLTGLADDDHPQYLNQTRGDLRYWPLSTDLATQTELDAHLNDTTDAHDASAISVVDAGGHFAGADVETVLTEIYDGATSTDGDLQAHIADTTDAHDASAISVVDAGNHYTGTDVETVLGEAGASIGTLQSQMGNKANEASAVMDGDAAGGVLSGTYPNPGFAADMATQAELNAAVASFGAASGISFTPTGTIAATNVQSAIAEAASEAAQKTVTLTAGSGLSGGGTLAASRTFDVNVDNSTIEVSGDALRLKDDGVTSAKIQNGTIVNADINAAAAIAYSKLNLSGSILPADLSFDARLASTTVLVDAGGHFTTDNVEAALAELATASSTPAAADVTIADVANDFTATNVEDALAELQSDAEADATALSDHIADAAAAHAASAVSVSPTGNISSTDVQAALAELDADITGITGGGTTPSGSAGGVLDGTYPNPGLAASVAGAALLETADVLDVQVDGSTIEVSSDALRVKDAGITNAKLATAAKTAALVCLIDGGGSTITTGVKCYLRVPFACTIVAARLLADQSGSIVVDVWKDTYANYPPTVADTITASAKPTIATATKSEDTTLTGWTTSIAAGDILGFKVDSITTCTFVTLELEVVKT